MLHRSPIPVPSVDSKAHIQEIAMQQKDKLDLSHKNPLDLIVDYRRFLVIVITVVTLVLAWHVPRLETDPTLRSGIDTESPEYQEYQRFVASFGNEEFMLFALKNQLGADDPRVLRGLKQITQGIGSHRKGRGGGESVESAGLSERGTGCSAIFRFCRGATGSRPFRIPRHLRP